jgi:hypothetical protein
MAVLESNSFHALICVEPEWGDHQSTPPIVDLHFQIKPFRNNNLIKSKDNTHQI